MYKIIKINNLDSRKEDFKKGEQQEAGLVI